MEKGGLKRQPFESVPHKRSVIDSGLNFDHRFWDVDKDEMYAAHPPVLKTIVGKCSAENHWRYVIEVSMSENARCTIPALVKPNNVF